MNEADRQFLVDEIRENRRETQEIRKDLVTDRKDTNSALAKKVSRAELLTLLTVIGLITGIAFA